MDSLGTMNKNIEKLRMHMIEIAESNGRTHPSPVEISMKLDELLNHYEIMKSKNEMKRESIMKSFVKDGF